MLILSVRLIHRTTSHDMPSSYRSHQRINALLEWPHHTPPSHIQTLTPRLLVKLVGRDITLFENRVEGEDRFLKLVVDRRRRVRHLSVFNSTVYVSLVILNSIQHTTCTIVAKRQRIAVNNRN